ncbi:MAG: hypothetical protein AAFQ89_05090 [Cyanobacteria bacterium J06626_18]
MTQLNGTPQLDNDDDLIQAIGHMGLRLDEMTLSVDRKIDTLLQETRQWEERQRTAIEQWGAVTHQLTELLSARTKETEGVATSYATLADCLMKFGFHLGTSESIMHAVEERLKHSSTLDGSSALTSTEALKLMTETKANQERLKALSNQIVVSLQNLAQGDNNTPKNLSIWTEVFAWRPAVAWFSIGGVGVAAFLLLTFRMSGFDLAVRSLLSVDRRLQRMEKFWEAELPDETTNPEFEEQPMPDE